MFGLSDFTTTIIVSVLSLFLVVTIILPNIFRVKKNIWLSIKTALFLILISLVIVFSDASLDSYYFLGSFLGVGFLVKGIISSSRMSLILFLFSFISFSLIFLSIGQTIFFIICICYAYVLMIVFTAFFIFKTKSADLDLTVSRRAQLSSFIILLAFPIISIYILLFLSQNQVIYFETISLYSLFSQNYEAIALLIVFLVFLVIMIFVFLIDLKNKHRRDEPWFT
ncbi:MAG: hypothetical protein GOP50_07795 [Candidatus Heimdallarchaeota archaeon]|nr:hypothetical protein [Candidatus Heimdallarchaeota archaeon]